MRRLKKNLLEIHRPLKGNFKSQRKLEQKKSSWQLLKFLQKDFR
jgi:hypothetical protein